MRQKLFFFIIPIFVFVLSGCSNDSVVPVNSEPQMPAAVSNMPTEEPEMIEEQTIETEVEPIENYESTDELLEDIDVMVDELDSI